MKFFKNFFLLILILLLILIPISKLYAWDVFGINVDNPNKETILEIVAAIIDFLGKVAGVLAMIFIVIAGLRYMTAQGNPELIHGAKSALLAAIIGGIIVFLSYIIVYWLNALLRHPLG